MDAEKAELKRLIELMGWTQTEAARRLHKTPSAINHLVNPLHSNKPTETMMQLLKVIIASERPGLVKAEHGKKKEEAPEAEEGGIHLNARERELIERLRGLPAAEQAKVYSIITVLLKPSGRKRSKSKKGS